MMKKKYKIERNLILNEVKEGGAKDRVMVIDENNEVGSVARSEFGGGESQNLQSVINTGGYFESIKNNYITSFNIVPQNTIAPIYAQAVDLVGNKGGELVLGGSGSFLGCWQDFARGFYSTVGVRIGEDFTNFGLKVSRNPIHGGTTGGASSLIFDTAGGVNTSTIFKLPSTKLSGTYYLATTEDIKLKEYTVATLPLGEKGDVAYVNDASSPVFLATVVGGGSAVVRVFYNGTNWIVQ